MKKSIKYLWVFVMLVVAGVTVAEAATVQITPSHATFVGTDHQQVEVVVDEVQDLLGVSLILEFDPAVVTPVAVYPADSMNQAGCPLFFQWVNQGSFVNTIELDMALLGCTANVEGQLFTIEFAGVGNGTTALTMQDLELRDGNNDPISVESIGGSLTYLLAIEANLSFQPEGVLFDEGGTCEICLTLENVDDFLGISVEFDFDPAVIVPISFSSAEALDNAGCPSYLSWVNQGTFTNTMELDVALLGCQAAMDGPVVCVTFQGVAFGETTLNWVEVLVRDSNNNPILVNLFPGEVLYNSSVDVEPVSFSGLKSFYRD